MSYSNGNGQYQNFADALMKLVPAEGEIKSNPTLERFRVACNNYYDVMNNGGGNRGRSIGKMFPGVMSHINERLRFRSTPNWDAVLEMMDGKMDEIILAAAKKNLS
ncbi:hypothetical protein N9A42_00160 [bacterium]|jgi:hypothetical protein|nr:hypothetical protein [bacterium]